MNKEMTNKTKFDIDTLTNKVADKGFQNLTKEEKDFYADWRRKEAIQDMKERSLKEYEKKKEII